MHASGCIRRYLRLSVGKWGPGRKRNLLGFLHGVMSDGAEAPCWMVLLMCRLFTLFIIRIFLKLYFSRDTLLAIQ